MQLLFFSALVCKREKSEVWIRRGACRHYININELKGVDKVKRLTLLQMVTANTLVSRKLVLRKKTSNGAQIIRKAFFVRWVTAITVSVRGRALPEANGP